MTDTTLFSAPWDQKLTLLTVAGSTLLLLGATLAVWNDDPSSPDAQEPALAAGIAPRLRILAQKTWGSPAFARDYTTFAPAAAKAAP